MKYALFIIFEKAAKFEIVVCCKLEVVLYWLITHKSSQKVCVCVILLPDGPYLIASDRMVYVLKFGTL